MFRTVLYIVMSALGLIGLVAVAAEQPAQDQASVIAEPLNCQSLERQVVCTDRSMHGEAVCSRLDPATIYCTTRKRSGHVGRHVVVAATAVVPKL